MPLSDQSKDELVRVRTRLCVLFLLHSCRVDVKPLFIVSAPLKNLKCEVLRNHTSGVDNRDIFVPFRSLPPRSDYSSLLSQNHCVRFTRSVSFEPGGIVQYEESSITCAKWFSS